MFGWWRRRKELQARVDADATAMIAEFGASACHVARDRALEQRLHKIVDAERTPSTGTLCASKSGSGQDGRPQTRRRNILRTADEPGHPIRGHGRGTGGTWHRLRRRVLREMRELVAGADPHSATCHDPRQDRRAHGLPELRRAPCRSRSRLARRTPDRSLNVWREGDDRCSGGYDSDSEFNSRHSVAVAAGGAVAPLRLRLELVEFDDHRFHMALSLLRVNRTVDLGFRAARIRLGRAQSRSSRAIPRPFRPARSRL